MIPFHQKSKFGEEDDKMATVATHTKLWRKGLQ